MFPAETPVPTRPPTVKQFLLNHKKQVQEREKKECRDLGNYFSPGIGTLADEVTTSDYSQVSLLYWNQATEDGLKHRADYLLSFALCCRGGNIRQLKLPNIGGKFCSAEGVEGVDLLRVAWNQSKKNQFGKLQQTCLIRSNLIN